MKSFKFIILFMGALINYSSSSYGQNNCSAYVPSGESFARAFAGECTDPESVLPNFNGDLTFNLRIINVGKTDGSELLTSNQINDIKLSVEQVYSPHDIYFVYEVIPIQNTELYNDLYADGYNEIIENYSCNSIVGLVSKGNSGGESPINSGTFISTFLENQPFQQTFCHELGHSLGLYHTFRSDSGSLNEQSSENITRIDEPECACDCLQKGDMVCDTPADPTIPTQDSYSIGCDGVYNPNNLNDDCDVQYGDEMLPLIGNIMTYSISICGGHISDGQERLIREKLNEYSGLQEKLHTEEFNFSNINVINSPVTLESDTKFNNDVVVSSKLTINNAVIEFTEGHGFTVNPSGALVVNNSSIGTSNAYCSGLWKGIEILPGSSDFTRVSILDKSIINLSESGIFNPAGTSGLAKVNVYNSTIDGPSIHLSNISGTSRLKDSDFNNTVKFTNGTSLRVLGCNFNFPAGSETSGIKALDTRLYLQKYYDGSGTFSNNSFTNCGKAIEFVSSSSHSCIISNSDFTDVLTGISAKNVGGFMKVNNCDVSLRDPSGTQGFGDGILVDNFIDFAIYNNEITGNGSAFQKGIEIVHTGLNNNPNLLINNTISDCFKGISTDQAELGNIMSGVEFDCNTMINIANDNFHTNKIGPHQGRGENSLNGVPPRPAGNKFDGSTIGFQDFNYEAGGFTDIKTYHYRDVGNENIQNYNDGSQVTGVPVFTIDRLTGGETPQCAYPIKDNNPIPLPDLPTSHTDYTSMFDGGSTDDNINLVFTDSNSDPNGVLSEVMDDSPWVSIPVAQALLANSQYYTEGQIAQVIIQNPGVLDDNFISEIVFSTNSFSASNQQLMLQSYQNGDTRLLHEQSLLDIIYEGTLHIKDEITDQVINDNFDEITIRNQISSKFSKTKLFQTVESYTKEGDYANAILTLNSKVDAQTYDPLLVNESLVYGEILTIGASLYNGGDSWAKIPNTDKTRLIAIANSYNGLATKKARNILEAYHDMEFGGMPQRPNYSPISFLGASPRSENISGIIEVFPNPTNGVLNIAVLSGEDQYTMDIMSLDGRIIKTFDVIGNTKINVSDISKGVYIYSISNASGLFANDKIIILK